MKRAGKGLFISSIVMVLVVAVSLVTSTFAWFSSTASADINTFDVTTKASEGIQIAKVNDSGTGWMSGDLSLTDGEWSNGSAGWGAYLALAIDASVGSTDALSNVVGVSGDGVDMYKQYDADNTQQNNKPADDDDMVEAVANTDFLMLRFSLKNTKGSIQNILLQSITTTATTNQMAASARIAFFVTDTAVDSWDMDYANLLYVPYGKLAFSTGTYSDDKATPANNYYITSADEYETALGTELLSTTWSGKVIAATLTVDTHYAESTGLIAGAALTSGSTTVPTDFVHTLAEDIANKDAIYCTMVVWFDGEDQFSTTALAGGGISISVNFSTGAATTVTP